MAMHSRSRHNQLRITCNRKMVKIQNRQLSPRRELSSISRNWGTKRISSFAPSLKLMTRSPTSFEPRYTNFIPAMSLYTISVKSWPPTPDWTLMRLLVILYLTQAWRAAAAANGTMPMTVSTERPGTMSSVFDGGPSKNKVSGSRTAFSVTGAATGAVSSTATGASPSKSASSSSRRPLAASFVVCVRKRGATSAAPVAHSATARMACFAGMLVVLAVLAVRLQNLLLTSYIDVNINIKQCFVRLEAQRKAGDDTD